MFTNKLLCPHFELSPNSQSCNYRRCDINKLRRIKSCGGRGEWEGRGGGRAVLDSKNLPRSVHLLSYYCFRHVYRLAVGITTTKIFSEKFSASHSRRWVRLFTSSAKVRTAQLRKCHMNVRNNILSPPLSPLPRRFLFTQRLSDSWFPNQLPLSASFGGCV